MGTKEIHCSLISTPGTSAWQRFSYQTLAREIADFGQFFDQIRSWEPRPEDTGLLSELLQLSVARATNSPTKSESRNLIVLNGHFNFSEDIQGLLTEIRKNLNRSDRVAVVVYNSYLSPLYRLASQLGFRKGPAPCTFVTSATIENLCEISGFQVVRRRPSLFIPFNLFGIGGLLNRMLAVVPLLNRFSFVEIFLLKPSFSETRPLKLSVVIPARNERGNIEDALKRMPTFDGLKPEIVFVEGHSKDGTWEEIQRVAGLYSQEFEIKTMRQTGVGKADAVRAGFEVATGDLLTILDADLTMPPEQLPRFYQAYTDGRGDFVNGTRLVYKMEDDAMRFLNRLGNIFFAKALSYVLGVRLGDSLCGTKLFSKRDYERFKAWRKKFGEFDPFGDFEMIFPAAVLGLGIVDMPVKYRSRTYGSTNIHRFRHGLILLKMTLIGFFRIKLGKS